MSQLIYKKITTVMSEINAVGKDSRNTQQNFNFRGIDAVMNELHPLLAKHGLFVVPEVIDEKREERQTKSGGVMTYALMKIRYTLYAEDGSSVSAVMIGEGSDTGDKASNKAQSIALKYFFLQVFAIPTEDDKDPDAQSNEKMPPAKPANSANKTPKSASLVEAFRKLGVSERMIVEKYKVPSADELSPEMIEDLLKIGPQLKNKTKKVADFFAKGA